MEPLEPQFREALKREHPDLSDADIDRYEELVALRFRIDPDREADRLRRVDEERDELVRRAMPRYREVWQRHIASRRLGA